MFRTPGDSNYPSNLEVLKSAPIDARLKCPTFADLLGDTANGATAMPFAYKGMIVAVTDDADPTNNGVYVRVGEDLTSGTSVAEDWKKIDEVGGSFRFLGVGFDSTPGAADPGFLINNPDNTYSFLQGDVFRISVEFGVNLAGLYYVTEDFSFDTSVSDALIPTGLTNAESAGSIILFEPEAEASLFRFLGLAFDPINETGFLYNGSVPNVAFEFKKGDVFRVKRNGYTSGLLGDIGTSVYVDGLYYVEEALTWPSDIPNTEAGANNIEFNIEQGRFVLFEPEDDLYLSDLVVNNPTLATPEAHGGIDAGVTVATLQNGTNTVSDILDMILFPPVCPTPVVPSIGFTDSPNVISNSNTLSGANGSAVLHLVGDSITATFNLTADGGSIPGQAGTYAGAVTAATMNGGALVVTGDYDVADFSLSNYTVALGLDTWTYSVTFAAGQDVLDSYDNATCGNYAGGTLNRYGALEGVYPVFLGTDVTYTSGQVAATWSEAMGETGNTSWSPMALFSFVNNSSKAFTLSYQENNSAGSYVNHRIAVPAALGLSDIQQDSVITGISSIFGQFTTSNVNLTINGQSVSYVIYERTNAAPGDAVNYIITW